MATQTGIEWTDTTWNPVTGCSKVSPGCAHCYAETVAARFWPLQFVHTAERGFISVNQYRGEAMTGTPRAFTDLLVHPERLKEPLRWRRPRRVFVNSMSDLFHESVPDNFIDQVFAVMAATPRHTFQILTKRASRMRAYVESRKPPHFAVRMHAILDNASAPGPTPTFPWPLPNVWLGVSVENEHFADERIPLLLQTPAAVRFISAEPLLGPIDLHKLRGGGWLSRNAVSGSGVGDLVSASGLERLDWVIVGGESGPKARPCDVAWIRSIVQQCQAAGVACFVKQLGARPSLVDRTGNIGFRGQSKIRPSLPDGFYRFLNDRKGGDPTEWPADLRVREFPEIRA